MGSWKSRLRQAKSSRVEKGTAVRPIRDDRSGYEYAPFHKVVGLPRRVHLGVWWKLLNQSIVLRAHAIISARESNPSRTPGLGQARAALEAILSLVGMERRNPLDPISDFDSAAGAIA